MSEEEPPTMESLSKLRVADLRKQLTDLGLATNGMKSDLVQRMFAYHQETAKQDVKDEEEPPTESSDVPLEAKEEEPPTELSDAPVEAQEKEPPTEIYDSPIEAGEAKADEPRTEISDAPFEAEKAKEYSEEQQQTASRLNVQFGPPKVHPAGPPPEEAPKPPSLMSLSVEPPPPAVAVAPPPLARPSPDVTLADDDEEGADGEKKVKQHRQKKKKKKKNRPEIWARQAVEAEKRRKESEAKGPEEPDVEVEYIQEQLDLDPMDPMYRTFNKIFQAFKIVDPAEQKAMQEEEEARRHAEQFKKVPKLLEEDDMLEEDDKDATTGEPKLSKRKLKKLNRHLTSLTCS